MITTKERSWSVEELRTIPVRKPAHLGSRWQGIQHGTLVDTIHTELSHRGVEVESEGWYPSGVAYGRLHGSMRLIIPGRILEEEMGFSLGVQHSNLGDHALKFAIGAEIFICSNGVVVGDYALKRRHTTGVNLPEIVGDGIETYLSRLGEVEEVTTSFKGWGLDGDEVDHLLMRAGREGLLPWSRIGGVDAEYHKPSFRNLHQKTAWGLYNAFTYIMQKSPPAAHIKGINRFREIIQETIPVLNLN